MEHPHLTVESFLMERVEYERGGAVASYPRYLFISSHNEIDRGKVLNLPPSIKHNNAIARLNIVRVGFRPPKE